jgi:N utilization substance protein B
MPIVDVSILRLSVCEILCLDDVPNKVSINEAVEIAKVYCDDKTPKFINGILGSVLGEIE